MTQSRSNAAIVALCHTTPVPRLCVHALAFTSGYPTIQMMPASQLALVGCLTVLVVPFLDYVSGRRRVSTAIVFAAMLACAGAVLLQMEEGELMPVLPAVVLRRLDGNLSDPH